MAYDNKSSANIEREVQAQRDQVEARIGEIKDRLSPGQLIDEVLSYTKHGGSHFASNLAGQVSANPMPAALVGIGLAWLMASNGNANGAPAAAPQRSSRNPSYPYARVGSGALRRVRHEADAGGEWWSEFETDTGSRYKAKSNSLGQRASHFTDESGKIFAGFIDDAGNRIQQFQDDAGNVLDDAQSWANHSWHDVQQEISERLGSVGSAAKDGMTSVASRGRLFGGTVQGQSEQLSRTIATLFDQQPLIAGALAFAAGAALGASLPHTDQEDQLVGEQADALRDQAITKAGELYDQGKEKAGEIYEQVADQGTQIYSDAKERLGLDGEAMASSSNQQ